jgi:hypothetical protein
MSRRDINNLQTGAGPRARTLNEQRYQQRSDEGESFVAHMIQLRVASTAIK